MRNKDIAYNYLSKLWKEVVVTSKEKEAIIEVKRIINSLNTKEKSQ